MGGDINSPVYEHGESKSTTDCGIITVLMSSPKIDELYKEYIYFVELKDGDVITYEVFPETELQLIFEGVKANG